MKSDPSQNPYFQPTFEFELSEPEARSRIRSQFFDVRSRFLDRLACAQVFDGDLFDALLLWLDLLQRAYNTAGLAMSRSDFSQFDSIANYLEQEATHSPDQQAECAAAHAQWLDVMRQYNLLPEERS